MNKKSTFLFFLVIFALPLFAQRKEKIDKPTREKIHLVYLTDGSILKGKIHSKTKRTINFTLAGDSSETVINRQSVKRINTNISVKSHNKYLFDRGRFIKKEGYYATIDLSTTFLPNSITDGYGVLEYGLFHQVHASFGKMYNDFLVIGIGTGIERHYGTSSAPWEFTRTYTFIPVYAEVRGYHFKKKISPYYNLAFGVGIAKQPRYGYAFSSGLFFRPALGVRFATKNRLNYFLEMGYHFQKTVTEQGAWGFDPSGTIYTEDISLRNSTFSIGLLF